MTIYRCDRRCPIGKRCFIAKTDKPLPSDTVFVHRCVHLKKDIPVLVGKSKKYQEESKTE